jgi:hypothetical protein
LSAELPQRLRRTLGLAALAWAGVAAWLVRWTADDAFISFRYARNLVEGHGLVFNVGERVEGFSNLAWTLWCALGLSLGAHAEAWTTAWSLGAYLACVGLLWWNHRRLEPAPTAATAIPLAALGAALNPAWNVWATGGLETTPFALLLLAAFLCATRVPGDPRLTSAVAAGGLAAAAALTRPDGMLPALVLGALLLRWCGLRSRAPWIYALALAAIWLPVTWWRVDYYGDFLPNTYYAKSAGRAWYGQGLRYLALWLERYWILLLGPALWWVGGRGRAQARPSLARRQLEGAVALALAYGWFVVRVGGDFMFARMWIPITPFLLLLLELGWLQVARRRARLGAGIALALLAIPWFSPPPVRGDRQRHGVANERDYYSAARVAELEHWSGVLARYFAGLDVGVAFYGDEARLVYRARFPVAVESHSGLTDRFIARQPLERRGRPGHEKLAPLDYLIERRRLDFTFSKVPQRRLRAMVPEVIVRFDDDVYGQLLHWDPRMVASLRERGAEVPDFERMLDGLLASLDDLPDARVEELYSRVRRFYFDHVDDPAREARFERRLGSSRGSGGSP